MKYILIILFLVPILSYSQDTTLITNLQVKGGTAKVISALIYGASDTAISSAYFKMREDYIDGSPPNDNANVTISILKTTTVAYIYGILKGMPAGLMVVNDVLAAFTSDISSKRATNSMLDRLCDEIDAIYVSQNTELLTNGNKFLLNK